MLYQEHSVCRQRFQTSVVCALLFAQAGLLAYSATRHSPTHLEPAFLASGIAHWQLARFELYRVNPPRVRMIAALPVLAVGCKTDWNRFEDSRSSRAEFRVGEDFIRANGPASIPIFVYARWACIPFSLLGAFYAYRWANELYGGAAGLVALTLYVFEPNLLAHGELITPDGACTALGIVAGYTFWRWLKEPACGRAFVAGAALGLAELTKMSWLILFAVWPALWLFWRGCGRWRISPVRPGTEQSDATQWRLRSLYPGPAGFARPSFRQLAMIVAVSVWVINAGYGFDGFGWQIGEFQFGSTTFTGRDFPGRPGNRFRDGWLSAFPVPLPAQYVLGLDRQKQDLEYFPQKSYLRGKWKQGGWWYYYLYGLFVKVPCGVWGLLGLVICLRVFERDRLVEWRDEVVLLTPAVLLLLVVSSQTAFNIHLRYAFPSLGLMLIFLGQAGARFSCRMSRANLLVLGLTAYSVVSALCIYPHQLAYFNDFAGGSKNGYRHLLGSSVDWGQDWLYAREIVRKSNGQIRLLGIPNALADAIAIETASHAGTRAPTNTSDDRPMQPATMFVVSVSSLLNENVKTRFNAVEQLKMPGYSLVVVRDGPSD